MSTLTAETFPFYGDEDDWFEAPSKTDHDSWSHSRGRRTFFLISSTARVAEEDIAWTSNALLPDVLWWGITSTPEIDAPDLTRHTLGGSPHSRAATRRIRWASTAHSVDVPFSGAWVPEIRPLDFIAHVPTRPLTDQLATGYFVVNVGNATRRRGYLDKWVSRVGIEIASVRFEIASRVRDLFVRAEDELAETGSAKNFGHRLQSIVREVGVPAVDAVAQIIQRGGTRDSLLFEVLPRLGMLEHPPSYRRRFDLLVEGLNSPSSTVRDGAGLGLAFLDDPAAIPHLEQAIRKERVRDLKDDLQLALDQLVETARSGPST